MRNILIDKGFIGTVNDMKYCIQCNAPKSYKGVYCKVCSYRHRTRPSGLTYNIQQINRAWIKKGQTLAKGTIRTPEQREQMSETTKGQRRSPATEFTNERTIGPLNYKWEGNDVGYGGLHTWIARCKNKTGVCVFCKLKKRTQWANISHEYKRELEDFMELCSQCHYFYDEEYRESK